LLPCFFGRDDELKTIANALRPDRQVWGALIRGPGGMGKTSLAVRAAIEAPRRQFGRILFLSAKDRAMAPDGPKKVSDFVLPSYMEMLVEIARLLGKVKLSRSREPNLAKLVLDALKPERALLLLDNLETLPDIDQDQLFNFVGRLPRGCKAIVTTRLRPEGDGRLIELGKLNKAAAFAYLEQLEIDRPLLKQATKDHRTSLYEETGGNPLLIRWVVGQLGRRHCSTVPISIEYLKGAPPENSPLDFILGDLVEDLSESERKAIKGLSGLPGAVDVRTLAQRAKLSITAATTVLSDLSDRGLIDANPTRQLFSVLPVVVAFLTARKEPNDSSRRRSFRSSSLRV
jgi:NB-ARC domain